MSKPTVTVTPEMSLEECCRIMEEKLIRRVPVVDDRGSCVGIIALADIALHTGKNVAGHIVREVSEPTSLASAASAPGR
jgi:CBS domain-containing protein